MPAAVFFPFSRNIERHHVAAALGLLAEGWRCLDAAAHSGSVFMPVLALQFLEIVLGAAKNLAARIGQVRRMRIAKAIDAHPLSPSKALAAASPIMHRCVPPSHALTAWAYDTASEQGSLHLHLR
ncbi:MAG TPA: hypothetical protein VJ251_17050 [Stellaceae bacterium]|nr:hypothetical protein [Stellaceae bacterium]